MHLSTQRFIVTDKNIPNMASADDNSSIPSLPAPDPLRENNGHW
jgi:hypothetical protein